MDVQFTQIYPRIYRVGYRIYTVLRSILEYKGVGYRIYSLLRSILEYIGLDTGYTVYSDLS